MAFTEISKKKLTEQEQKMVEDNVGLVHLVINTRWSTYKDLYEDFFQEGCLGLSRAVQIYDETKGAFSTIAYHYINGYIIRYFNFKESSDFKVTTSNYQEARGNRALRFDAPLNISNDDGDVIMLSSVIADKNDFIGDFEHEYSLKQDTHRVFRCISKKDYEFLINYTIGKKEPRKTKEQRTTYRRYQNLVARVRIFNKDFKL